ncbi:MAG: sugar ABC transporter substrate-binding protein [Candidatus Faecousia sp.]|nr:sugar ABC transporter substrate-binding protein [Candidatus Faecousia sp.]
MKTTATKILAMVLALSMVFALCACGQNSATESSKPAEVKAEATEAPATEKPAEEKKHYTFGYLAYDMSDTWNEYSANAFMYAAEQQEDVEIEVVLLDPKMDLEASISAMESLIQQGVDGISAAPFSSEEGAQLVKMAKEAGIPITIENRKLDGVSEDDYIAAVACQYADIGYAAIEFIATTAPGSKIFYCAGKDGSGVTEQYIQGVNKALEDYGDKVELVATLNGDWKTDVSYDVTTNLISSGTEFTYIFANNDLQAMGCYNALKDAGMENIPIVSTGGSPDGYKMMCEGIEYANMTAPATLQGVKTFLNLYEYVVLGQEPAEKFTSLPVVPISQDNLDEWMQWDDYEVAYRYYVK